jgi:hypothetical protein
MMIFGGLSVQALSRFFPVCMRSSCKEVTRHAPRLILRIGQVPVSANLPIGRTLHLNRALENHSNRIA